MNAQLQKKAELMAANSAVVRKSSKLDFQQASNLGALMLTTQNVQANEPAIRSCRAILKSRVGIFNNMRGPATNVALLARMSVESNPEAYLDQVLNAYHAITEGKVFRNESLAFTAMTFADNLQPEEYEAAAQKSWATLAKMRAAHPLLTDQSDMTLAYLLSHSDIDATQVLEEAEECYSTLKTRGFFLNKETLQNVSVILALSPAPAAQKCARYNEIKDALKAAGHRIGSMEQAIIAGFVDLAVPTEQIVAEIGEVDEFLKHKPSFGAFTCGAQLRRMYAADLVLQTHTDSAAAAATASNSVTTTVVYQIISLIIMIIIMESIIVSSQSHSS